MKKVFLARPSYGPTEPESDYAAHHAVYDQDRYEVHAACFRQSMTCNNMNELLCAFRNRGGYDYFAMLHADVAPAEWWAQTLIERMEDFGLDVIHAPAAFKNQLGVTSTAVSYGDRKWGPNRRITTTELQTLPETFDIKTLRECYDQDATRMLFNTGCMVVRNGAWFDRFPGFTMWDRVYEYGGKWHAATVSEDYVLAHWCADNGIKAGATKIAVNHWGRFAYSTDGGWGQARDEGYFAATAKMEATAS